MLRKAPKLDQLEQIKFDLELVRREFRGKARAILQQAYQDAEALSTAIGTISIDEAYTAWVNGLIESVKKGS